MYQINIFYKIKLCKHLGIFLHKIQYIYVHNQDYFYMGIGMVFYRISHNISFCILYVHIYINMALYIFYMDLHIFMGILNENMKFYNWKYMADNLNYISYLSINDCKHLFYRIWMSNLHEIIYLRIRNIYLDKDVRILKSDCIFIYNLILLFFNCIYLQINGHNLI